MTESENSISLINPLRLVGVLALLAGATMVAVTIVITQAETDAPIWRILGIGLLVSLILLILSVWVFEKLIKKGR